MVQTIQIAGKKSDLGKSYKITPITTEKVLNQRTCFVMNGTKDAAVGVQAALPNTTGFVVRIGFGLQFYNINCIVIQVLTIHIGLSCVFIQFMNMKDENMHDASSQTRAPHSHS